MTPRRLRIAAALALLLAPAARAPAAEQMPASLAVEGMTFVASIGSQNDAVVEADQASFAPDERVARLSSVHARVGRAAGRTQGADGGFELHCERGRFDLESGDLHAEGKVRGVTADGRRFETERLMYRRATGRVVTQAPVLIRDGFATIRGAGFEYWVRENRFRLIGGASVEQGR